MTRARKRRLLMHVYPEHGMASKKFLESYIAVGVAKGKLDAELARLRRNQKQSSAESRAATEAVWAARKELVMAEDQLIRMRWWEHVSTRIVL